MEGGASSQGTLDGVDPSSAPFLDPAFPPGVAAVPDPSNLGVLGTVENWLSWLPYIAIGVAALILFKR